MPELLVCEEEDQEEEEESVAILSFFLSNLFSTSFVLSA